MIHVTDAGPTSGHPLSRMRHLVLPLLVVAGCGYNSEYIPPAADGRARPVWHENHVEVDLSGAQVSPACAEAMRDYSGGKLQLRRDGAPWAPVYYGPAIVVVTPGVVPVPPHPPLFVPHPVLAPHHFGGPVHGGGGANIGGGDGRGLEYLLIAALIVLPIIDVALAAADPVDGERTSFGIDQVNVFNDLARTPGSPCSYYGGAQ